MGNYALGLYEKSMPDSLTLKDKLLVSKKAGFDFLEISIDESDLKLTRLYFNKEQRLEIVRAIYETSQPIKTMCLSGSRKYPLGSLDKDARNYGVELIKKAITFACDIGVRVIQVAGYDVYYEESCEETRKHFKYNLEKCVDYASLNGVVLAFETMETEFMNTVEKALKYVNSINSPYLQVYPDTGNITNAAKKYNHDVIKDLIKGKGHIAALHLKESKPGVYREVPYGTGHVDFLKLIKNSMKIGVRLYVTEFWQENSCWEKSIEDNKLFFNRIFEEAIRGLGNEAM